MKYIFIIFKANNELKKISILKCMNFSLELDDIDINLSINKIVIDVINKEKNILFKKYYD